MGAVWLGRDEVLGRPVAVKRVGDAPGTTAPDLERAEREARIAARLNHPNVVAVFDLVTEDDVRWLVMEYVAGATLAELISRRGPLPLDDAAAVLEQVAEALGAAHAAGIVHRDVKPSNILVGDDGSVKISDFGIARAETDASLTQTGLVTGSPAYLAPEVASGEQATSASDVWSLGATAYHAVTGRPPYDVGENLMGALYRIVHEPAPSPDHAGWLAPLISATMVHDPGRRWQMAEVLEFLNHPPGHSDTVRAVPAPAPDLAPAMPSPGPVQSSDTDAPSARPHDPRHRALGVLPLLVTAAAVALVVMVALLITRDNAAEVSADPSSAPTSSATTISKSNAPAKPTKAGIEKFIGDYLQTASSDPRAGFEMLTKRFQRASPRYEEFWGSVSDPQITSISADPEARTVTYRYRYTFAGDTRSERVSLQLAFRNGTYLIDDES